MAEAFFGSMANFWEAFGYQRTVAAIVYRGHAKMGSGSRSQTPPAADVKKPRTLLYGVFSL
jgi:hypothetical protein